MDYPHLCLSDLLDQDTTANEYYQTLDPQLQRALQASEIATFAELQAAVARLREVSNNG